jgi:hypothetical protein
MTCYTTDKKGSYSTAAVTFGRNQVKKVSTSKVTEWTARYESNLEPVDGYDDPDINW